MRALRTAAVTVAAAALSALTIAAPASATTSGTTDGCTPGYWKNHTSNWFEGPNRTQPISPRTTLGSLFSATQTTGFAGTTMLQALQGGGGSGVDGAERILLRAATASWLNSAHEELGYPLRRDGAGGTVARVNAALQSQDRATMLRLAEELDSLNNLDCPLGR